MKHTYMFVMHMCSVHWTHIERKDGDDTTDGYTVNMKELCCCVSSLASFPDPGLISYNVGLLSRTRMPICGY